MIKFFRRIQYVVLVIVLLFLSCSDRQNNKKLDVMSSGGFTAAYQILSPEFSNKNKITIKTVFGASMGGADTSIPKRLERNEPADVVILASQGLEKLISEGKVIADSRVDLASSRIGMVVRIGDSVPNIETVESLKRVLLDAKSIAYSASASGKYLSTKLFHELEIADQLIDKSIRVMKERVGAVVARGEAQIGFQQVSELLPIEGITYVGTIPEEVQKITIFSAGITSGARNIEAASDLIAYLSSTQAAKTIAKTGMDPMNND